jgi:prepilin-type processing-associated H-X9-DG protein
MAEQVHRGKRVWPWDKIGRPASVGLAGLLVWMATAAPGEADLPADVALVPADGLVMATIRVAELWNNEVIKPARVQVEKQLAEPLRRFEEDLGATPEQIERLTFFVTGPGPDLEMRVVALKRPYDRDKVRALAGPDAKRETFKGHLLFIGRANNAVALVGTHAYVLGKADPVKSLLDRTAKDGPLTPARRLAAEKHAVVLGFNVPFIAAEEPDPPPPMDVLKPLLAAKSAAVAADVGVDSKATLTLTFDGAQAAAKAVKPLQAGVQLARTGLAELSKQGRDPLGGELRKLLGLADTALKGATVEQDGATVRAVARLKVDAAAVTAGLVEAVRQQTKAVPRIESTNKLKQLILAMHNYNDAYGHLPPVAVFDKSGKPILSWRVLILPFIEQDMLYKQFHLDEPWDSKHNKELLRQVPPVYAPPGRPKSTDTYYRAFWGKGAAFEGKKPLRFPGDFPDGLSNTVMIAEAAEAVPWSKPEELEYDPAKPPPKLGGLFDDGFNAAFCDGSVRFLRKTIKPATLHLLIQRNDGQPIPGDF